MTTDREELEKAITRVVDECIEEGILADILSSQKAEVLELVLTTFDRELYEQGLKEEGEERGADKLSKLITALLDDGLVDVVRLVASDSNVRAEYYKKYGIK